VCRRGRRDEAVKGCKYRRRCYRRALGWRLDSPPTEQREAEPHGTRAGATRALLATAVVALASIGFDAVVIAEPAAALPDGRVYEQVTPINKNGNFAAGGPTNAAYARADGSAVVFSSTGAMGEASSSVLAPYVARRSSSGWHTSSTTPPQLGVANVSGSPGVLLPSQDFARFVFASFNKDTSYSPEQPKGPFESLDLYLTENAFAVPTWLGRPTITEPAPKPGENNAIDFLVAGATPDLGTVYFAYSGTLIPQDEERAPNVGDGMGHKSTDPWGFYERSGGVTKLVGVLPDGTASPFGAMPAAIAGDSNFQRTFGTDWQAVDYNGEVSADGSRAFFVSPDPVASSATNPGECETEGPCTTMPPELYVRETRADGSKHTVLVSQSQVLGHVGEPAPSGPVAVTDASIQNGESLDNAYVYASVDGSQAFFASADNLAGGAGGAEVKEYDFNLETGVLTFLPGVVGPIVAASPDGSDFIFENTAKLPHELDLWQSTPAGGHVTTITQLPPEPPNIGEPYAGQVAVEGRASSDGSVFVFETNAVLPGAFNNHEGFGEVYRYDVASRSLSCLSCAPSGVVPAGNAAISHDNEGHGLFGHLKSTIDTRAMSPDGSRVFFDTPNPLVPQDVNGKRDVYEWERNGAGGCAESPGCIYLISSGNSAEDSFYLDSSESGSDVFFVTTAALSRPDTDEAYDVYDARVPRPGDTPPPGAVPCEGDACQGPPSPTQLFAAPSSATFDGAGNKTQEAVAAAAPATRQRTRARSLARALAACRHKPRSKRHACEVAARKRYGGRPVVTRRATGGK
jgi:hypothetical protein